MVCNNLVFLRKARDARFELVPCWGLNTLVFVTHWPAADLDLSSSIPFLALHEVAGYHTSAGTRTLERNFSKVWTLAPFVRAFVPLRRIVLGLRFLRSGGVSIQWIDPLQCATQ